LTSTGPSVPMQSGTTPLDVMARFARLTQDGVDQVEAMRRVAPFFDRPPAREHPTTSRPELADADPAVAAVAAAAGRAASDELGRHDRTAPVPDGPATYQVDEGREALEQQAPHGQQADTLPDHARLHTFATTTASSATVLEASVRTPPEVVRDGYPEPMTAQVLAGGRVKAKTPDRTAPAAMRSTSLATAARAVSGQVR